MMNRQADTQLSDIRKFFLHYVILEVLSNVDVWPVMYLFQIFCAIQPGMMGKEGVLSFLFLDVISLYIILKPVFKYYIFMNYIKQQWPTDVEKERLNKCFADAASTFHDKMKISKEYTFIAMDQRIVETKQILSFQTERRKRTVKMREDSYDVIDTYVIAIVEDYESETLKKIDILKADENKKRVVEDTDTLISEATRILKTKIQE